MSNHEAMPKRLVQLDFLRGVAILLVLGRHHPAAPAEAGMLRWPATLWRVVGWTGVDLFFVLSGFLVGGLLCKELRDRGRLDLKRFLIRRGFKIWPSYYVYLGTLAVLMWSAWGYSTRRGDRTLWGEIWPSLLNVQNYFGAPRSHLWSLGVEEHFYILLPLALLGVSRLGRAWPDGEPRYLWLTPLAVASVAVVCMAWRVGVAFSRPYRPETHHFPTHLRIDSLAFGFLLAYVYHFRPAAWAGWTRRPTVLVAAGLLLALPAAVLPLTSPLTSSVGFTLLYLGSGALLAACVSTPPGRGWLGRWWQTRAARIVAAVGFYSYPIYLWHVDVAVRPVEGLVESGVLGGLPGPAAWAAITAAYLALAGVAGVLLGSLVERPALALRDRLFPSRVGIPVPAAGPPAARPPGPERVEAALVAGTGAGEQADGPAALGGARGGPPTPRTAGAGG